MLSGFTEPNASEATCVYGYCRSWMVHFIIDNRTQGTFTGNFQIKVMGWVGL